jgi:hypothetical protein
LDVELGQLNVQAMRQIGLCATALLFLPSLVHGQFVPLLLQNRSYWGDGKSEIDFYQAEFPRDGEPHQCEVLMTLTPVFVTAEKMEPAQDPKQAGVIPAIRMNQTATIPRGLINEPRSVEAVWRMDTMSLARLSFIGNDGIGNVSETIRETREPGKISWIYLAEGYEGSSSPIVITLGTKPTVSYDELPLRVRTLDFSKPTGEMEIDLSSSISLMAKDLAGLKPARIKWNVGERVIDVEVEHPAGKEHFAVDPNFPFLLREWKACDGTHWKMKNSIRADYRKYLRNGDRERAWKDPMLRHPD